VKSQQPADRLVRLIKQAIDRSIANTPELQKFLTWVLQKAGSVQARYKPAAIRAFYFVRALDLACTLAFARDFTLAFARDRALDLARALACTLAFARARVLALALPLPLDLARVLALDFARVLALDFALALPLALDLSLARDLNRALALARDLSRALSPELASKLEQLRMALLKVSRGNREFQQWWQANGTQWIEQLRQAMIEHRNIGHNWQFDDAQTQQLQRYYNANKFLVDLMKIKGAVSGKVRAEIEDMLLLPWDELQRRHPETYERSQSVISAPISIFISYAYEDEDLWEKLDQHLANLKRQGKIQAWHKGAIAAGTEWGAVIQQQLEDAQIILLLISSNFIASDSCYNLQLQQALQRHAAKTARVIPILLKPTDWQGSPFSQLSPLPKNGTPITRWDNQDEAFLNVIAGIREAIASLQGTI
jgi:hypothetical protein